MLMAPLAQWSHRSQQQDPSNHVNLHDLRLLHTNPPTLQSPIDSSRSYIQRPAGSASSPACT